MDVQRYMATTAVSFGLPAYPTSACLSRTVVLIVDLEVLMSGHLNFAMLGRVGIRSLTLPQLRAPGQQANQ